MDAGLVRVLLLNVIGWLAGGREFLPDRVRRRFQNLVGLVRWEQLVTCLVHAAAASSLVMLVIRLFRSGRDGSLGLS